MENLILVLIFADELYIQKSIGLNCHNKPLCYFLLFPIFTCRILDDKGKVFIGYTASLKF